MDYQIESVFSGDFLCGEGPIWDEKNELLYWTECLGDCIYKCVFNEQQQGNALFHRGISAASLTLHQNGGLMISGKDGFVLLSSDKQAYYIQKEIDGISVNNLNDIIADPMGRIFSGQEVFVEDREYETGYLFRLDNNGDLKVTAEGLHLSNGMGFSPDCTRFYLVDSILGKIYEFDYNMVTGDIGNQKELIRFDRDDGLPDGITVDSQGFIWAAMFFGGKILRIDPSGTIERTLRLPFTQPTSVAFGGRELNELYVTSASFNWQTKYAPRNHDYNLPKGGKVYRIKMDIQGKSEFRAGFRVN